MKKVLSLLIVLLTLSEITAQLDCRDQLSCRITAPSGMRLRAQPSLNSKVVIAVPYDSLVDACEKTFGSMTYEGNTGYWRKVSYKGKVGYMFDGFLEVASLKSQQELRFEKLSDISPAQNDPGRPDEEPLASTTASTEYDLLTEAYNYCGDIKNIDPGLLWYGFYPAEAQISGDNIRIKPVNVEVVMSKAKVGKGLEFDIETDEEESSIFLVGLNRKLDIEGLNIPDPSEKLRSSGRKVFPGQEMLLNESGMPIKLTATGAVESTGPCPDLKNYKLLLKGEKSGRPVEQDITSELSYTGQCGMPEIYWYGDFTGDGVPEIIFVSVYEEKNHFSLFLSDPTQDNMLVRKEADWIIDKCY